ncbi:flavodoxin [Streptomyces triticagri]|uniref:Flavodoxin n=1 Tax=Streptomyces triticagri TaxID=2293568 RepID=A0A372MAH5_9ACTN|nr:flavodoxin family protein [Streptomyces triticagri]RFU87948.1 flavodoxin [Streptomyces triticagri]
MKTIVVCASKSHGNTRRIAERMAQVLEAKVVTPQEADPAELAEADLVGFGSGVYYGRMHPGLLRVVEALPATARGGRAFVFATSGFPEIPFAPYTRAPVRALERKGLTITGRFTCRALDTMGPLKLIGGVNKHHPTPGDLTTAEAFATRLRETYRPAR